MHIKALLSELTANFGYPVHLDGQAAYRWEVPTKGHEPTQLCLTVEEATRRASIWIFDPNQSGGSQTFYLEVNSQADVDDAVQTIKQHVTLVQPHESSRAP